MNSYFLHTVIFYRRITTLHCIVVNSSYITHGLSTYILVAVGSSGILKGKQKLGVTFNSDKLGGIDFTKFSKLAMYLYSA